MEKTYSSFAELAANEKAGVDYQIRVMNRGTPTAVFAPHGGLIEPGTSKIAETIAGTTHSYYVFEALRTSSERSSLRISSSKIDEPQALALLAETEKIVSIHGRTDNGEPLPVAVSGLDIALRDDIVAALNAAGFAAESHVAGPDLANICNRIASGAGVQLSLTLALRAELDADPVKLGVFCQAVRGAMVADETSPGHTKRQTASDGAKNEGRSLRLRR